MSDDRTELDKVIDDIQTEIEKGFFIFIVLLFVAIPIGAIITEYAKEPTIYRDDLYTISYIDHYKNGSKKKTRTRTFCGTGRFTRLDDIIMFNVEGKEKFIQVKTKDFIKLTSGCKL